MFLSFFIILLITLQILFRFSILNDLNSLNHYLHQACLSSVPLSQNATSTLEALVCGENFQLLSESKLYCSTGLIHLFVVSGSHLILVQKIFDKIAFTLFNKKIILFLLSVLFLYCSMCLFNPPVTRSFIYLIVTLLLSKNHIRWPKDYSLLITGLITIAVNFEWINSLSLQMSWLAVLALEVYSRYFKNQSIILRQFIFFLFFIFCFMNLGFPEISTMVVCIMLTPLLEYILFPFSILTVFFHWLEPLFSYFILALNSILTHLEFYSTPSQFNTTLMTQFNWALILLLHLILFYRKPKT